MVEKAKVVVGGVYRRDAGTSGVLWGVCVAAYERNNIRVGRLCVGGQVDEDIATNKPTQWQLVAEPGLVNPAVPITREEVAALIEASKPAEKDDTALFTMNGRINDLQGRLREYEARLAEALDRLSAMESRSSEAPTSSEVTDPVLGDLERRRAGRR